MTKISGFSLVELSIVLVILGLLSGGVITGKSLIRAAELRSVTTDLNKYNLAIYTFREKYSQLPGDMDNATMFWGAANTAGAGGECASPQSNVGVGTQTCNGDNNGKIQHTDSGGLFVNYHEIYRMWQHLFNAGLVDHAYTGVKFSTATSSLGPGINIPASRLGKNIGFSFSHLKEVVGHNWFFDQKAVNYYTLGAAPANDFNNYPAIIPEEALNIDKKMDDGLPAYGNVRAPKSTSGRQPNCTTTNVAATAQYNLQNSDELCVLWFLTDI